MDDKARHLRNLQEIQQLYPTMRPKIQAIINDLEGQGYKPRIQEAYRNQQAQNAALLSGHSKVRNSFHGITGPGGQPEALAVDLLNDQANVQQPSQDYLLRLASSAQGHGLMTGAQWGLPDDQRKAIQTAVANRNFDQPGIRLGWDPTHVQPVDITVEQAQRGKRPFETSSPAPAQSTRSPQRGKLPSLLPPSLTQGLQPTTIGRALTLQQPRAAPSGDPLSGLLSAPGLWPKGSGRR